MYKLISPILFQFSPEFIHKLVFTGLKIAERFRIDDLIRAWYDPIGLHSSTIVCGLNFPNKIGIAAGLDKNAEVYQMLGNFGFGHIEIGTVTPEAQPGNPKPRLFRLKKDKALINRMGFNNQGLEQVQIRLKNRNKKLIIGGNIGKNTQTPNEDAVNDYLTCFNGLYDSVDYITVNVSCPNISDLHKLQDQDELEKILAAINESRQAKAIQKPIFLKISPDLNLNQIDETLEVIHKCNIDGVIAVNTTILREGLHYSQKEIIKFGNGGLSGSPLKDRSTEIIRYISHKTNKKLPIIGVGGVNTPQDAIDKIEAGASLIQVYTGFIYNGPAMAKRINRELLNRLQS